LGYTHHDQVCGTNGLGVGAVGAEVEVATAAGVLKEQGVALSTATMTMTNKTLTAPKINENVALLASATELNALDGITAGMYIKGQQFTISPSRFAAADIGSPFWIAPAACEVVEARETHVTVCDAADTITVEKTPSGTAPGSGTVVLIGNFTLNSTANTPVTVACHGTAATRQLAAGDSLNTKFVSGDGTNYAKAVLEVVLKWI